MCLSIHRFRGYRDQSCIRCPSILMFKGHLDRFGICLSIHTGDIAISLESVHPYLCSGDMWNLMASVHPSVDSGDIAISVASVHPSILRGYLDQSALCLFIHRVRG